MYAGVLQLVLLLRQVFLKRSTDNGVAMNTGEGCLVLERRASLMTRTPVEIGV